MGNTAKQYGIKIAIEALSYRETNLANKVSEAVDFANRINLNNVGVLVDFFQYALNKENDGGLICAKDRLFHAHLARANLDRRMPTEEDIPHVKKWSCMLRDIGYDQCISLEGAFNLESLQQTKKIVDLFR